MLLTLSWFYKNGMRILILVGICQFSFLYTMLLYILFVRNVVRSTTLLSLY